MGVNNNSNNNTASSSNNNITSDSRNNNTRPIINNSSKGNRSNNTSVQWLECKSENSCFVNNSSSNNNFFVNSSSNNSPEHMELKDLCIINRNMVQVCPINNMHLNHSNSSNNNKHMYRNNNQLLLHPSTKLPCQNLLENATKLFMTMMRKMMTRCHS